MFWFCLSGMKECNKSCVSWWTEIITKIKVSVCSVLYAYTSVVVLISRILFMIISTAELNENWLKFVWVIVNVLYLYL